MLKIVVLILALWANVAHAHHAEEDGMVLAILDHVLDYAIDNFWFILVTVIVTRWLYKFHYGVLDELEKDQPKAKELTALVEEHDGILYAFNEETNQFIFQTPSYPVLEKYLKDNFKGIRVTVVATDKQLFNKLTKLKA